MAIRVSLPNWLAKKNGLPMVMEGFVEAETEKAILFNGQAFAEERIHCLRCGRELTHPSSRLVGFGPICSDYIGVKWPTEGELTPEQIEQVKAKIREIVYVGWLPKSQIEIEGEYEVKKKEIKPEANKAMMGLNYKKYNDGTLRLAGFAIRSPYKDKEKCAKVKQEFGGKWNPTRKQWEFPLLEQVVDKAKEVWNGEIELSEKLVEYLEELEEKREMAIKAKQQIDESGLKTPVKDKLYPFQRVGVGFLKKARKAILGDDMGLGKTLQALAVTDELSAEKVLIIAPNTLKSVWRNEIEKWFPGTAVQVIDGPKKKREEQLKSSARYIIINYEATRLHTEELTREWDVVILDEAHRAKNRKAQQTKACQKIAKGAKALFHLSGTPIMNRPYEIWTLLNMIDPKKFSSFWRFVDMYCEKWYDGYGWNIGGVLDPEEFRHMLAPYMLRRKKEQVLKDLPSKTVQQIPVTLEGKQKKIYQQMKDQMVAELAEKETISAPVVIAQITRLKQICVSPNLLGENGVDFPSVKLDALDGIIDDSNGQGIVVFSQFAKAIRLVERRLRERGIEVRVLTGDTKQKDREQAIKDFQEGKAKVFLTTIQAGGQGITLTAGSIAIFLDKHWTPANNNQAIDRLHRIGQEKPVTVYELIAEDTVEDWIERLLEEKTTIFKQLIEGEKVGSRELISQIFGDEQ